VLHIRIPTRVIPPSTVHRSLGDPNVFPSSLHCSIDFWCRRRYDHLLICPSGQLFPFVFVHPLSLSALTIGFFDSPNLYYRSYAAVSQRFAPRLPLLPLAMYDPRPSPCLRAPLSLKPNDGETLTYSDLYPFMFAVQ
jgi:hypothetical protein